MSDKLAFDTETLGNIEAKTRRVSLIVSLVSVSLMILGFTDAVLNGTTLSVPGRSVLPVSMLLHVSQVPVSLATMSVGVLLLALLPAVRVLLAVVLYISERGALNAAVSLVVLVELLVSMRAGG
jgi:uncharacterized membrane protein